MIIEDGGISQTHEAHTILEAMIVTLKLKPGELVTERQLFELVGLGRTPVREAILQLSWQGLVVVKPRVGLMVTKPEEHDAAFSMDVRKQLEPSISALVAANGSESTRRNLLSCEQVLTSSLITGDIEAYLQADQNFSQIFETACPNRFLISAVRSAQSHTRRLWFIKASVERMDRAVQGHIRVIRAVQQQNAVDAFNATVARMQSLAEDLTA
ncbi:GntR family transcriptional regulator [Rhizobium sp. CFBP 8762]|uniref:GntR family transcriptional regulator n=1 Tax=Rhizobium sp. CFBP 8762 TaxID=2775279 RepID=UPI00178704BC|nr:GntR family transcriptional regulator [Rhizobium sp. CFBP 8762]MBD8555649.1 GntR family transcriptional regulator [Rhizobium sp. CFBP 8762]